MRSAVATLTQRVYDDSVAARNTMIVGMAITAALGAGSYFFSPMWPLGFALTGFFGLLAVENERLVRKIRREAGSLLKGR